MKPIRSRKPADAMVRERLVIIENKTYPVVISDEQEALLAAKAAGRAVLGFWDPAEPEKAPFGVPYLMERGAEISEEFLERIVRRQEGLAWNLAETKRLLVRELKAEDWETVRELQKEPDVCGPGFSCREAFEAYLRVQYPLYEYGLWAVTEKHTGRLIGAAGYWNLNEEELPKKPEASAVETGYWIRPGERRKGFAAEAMTAVLQEADRRGCSPVYAKIREDNLPSRNLAVKLGFHRVLGTTDSAGNGSRQWYCRYAPNC